MQLFQRAGAAAGSAEGCPHTGRTVGLEEAHTEEPLLNTVQVVLSYLWLRGESLLPAAKCFSKERPDSALRNLLPFFQTGDKVDGKYPQQRCVGQTGSELFLLRSDKKLRVQFRPPGLKWAKLQLLFPAVCVRTAFVTGRVKLLCRAAVCSGGPWLVTCDGGASSPRWASGAKWKVWTECVRVGVSRCVWCRELSGEYQSDVSRASPRGLQP